MIEIEEYLSKFEEPLPKWLDDNNYQTKPSFETLLKTRVVYYPGADIDG